MKESRREFLKKASCSMGMAALATQVQHFGLMNALAQQATSKNRTKNRLVGSDYKAMVCIFLSGGNDGNNTIIPIHNDSNVSNYSDYAATRSAQGLALAQNSLLPISVPSMGNLSYGLHPSFGQFSGSLNNGIHELLVRAKWLLQSMSERLFSR